MIRETARLAVHEARDAAPDGAGWQSHWRGPAVALAAAVLFSLAGAFETWRLAPLPRAVFWVIVMLSGALLGIGASSGVKSWGRLSKSVFREGALVGVLVAVPQALLVTGTAAIFFGPQIVSINHALLLFASVTSVTAATTAVSYLVQIRGKHVAAPVPVAADDLPASVSEEASPATPPRLSDRLPLRLRHAAIRALEAEDHYVRVHTDAGSDLLLLRMTDAIAELDAMPGARTHRSWWVARDAVTVARRFDGRGELELADGTVAPVSRSALQELQREGWFGGRSSAA